MNSLSFAAISLLLYFAACTTAEIECYRNTDDECVGEDHWPVDNKEQCCTYPDPTYGTCYLEGVICHAW